MTIIKNAHSDRLLKKAVVLDMGDLGLHAQRILQTAQDQAKKIVDAARLEAQRLTQHAAAAGHQAGVEAGRIEGHEAGRLEARQQALKEFQERFQALENDWTIALEKWETDRQLLLNEASEVIIQVAIEVANKVVRRLIQVDRTIINSQLEQAVQMIGKCTAVEICIHPADRELMNEILPALAAKTVGCKHVSIRENESMQPGGCVVSTAAGRIDASIETQLNRIAMALSGQVGESTSLLDS